MVDERFGGHAHIINVVYYLGWARYQPCLLPSCTGYGHSVIRRHRITIIITI